jgi:hypothetical protein
MVRPFACAVLSAAVLAATPAFSETHDIGEVFRDFESVCFAYAEEGYGVDVSFLIEQAGFKFSQKTKDGADVFNAPGIQLVIGDHACAFGMVGLPYSQMRQWTKSWAEAKGLNYDADAKRPSGEFSLWRGEGFNIGLQDDKFPDGTPITGLVLMRTKKPAP